MSAGLTILAAASAAVGAASLVRAAKLRLAEGERRAAQARAEAAQRSAVRGKGAVFDLEMDDRTGAWAVARPAPSSGEADPARR